MANRTRRFFSATTKSTSAEDVGESAQEALGTIPDHRTLSQRYRSGSLINDALLRTRMVSMTPSSVEEDFTLAPKNLAEVRFGSLPAPTPLPPRGQYLQH